MALVAPIAMGAEQCREAHRVLMPQVRAETVPAGLSLWQVGFMETAENAVFIPDRMRWFSAYYNFDRNLWGFSDRMLDGYEMEERFATANYSPLMMSFTYDTYFQRSFRRTKLNPETFVKTLTEEDTSAREESTAYFGFHIGSEFVATAKTSIYESEHAHLLPLGQKLPVAAKYFKKHHPKETLVEIGRLAKLPKINIETIFSSISHHLYQRGVRSGLVLGHAAPAQASVYVKLGFHVIMDESALGVDHVIVAMSMKDFVRKFPPLYNQVVQPSLTSWLDEVYYQSYTSSPDQK